MGGMRAFGTRMIYAAVTAGLSLMMLGMAGPAAGHAVLESSDPADGASLKLAPKAVSLVFGEDLLSGGSAITATDLSDNSRVALGEPELDGDTLRVAWPSGAPGGSYKVAFRVVSADGHPITGSINFKYKQARVTATGATPSSSASGSASSTPTIGADQSDPAEALGPTPDKEPVSPPVLAAALGLGIVALGATGLGLWHTSRRR